MVWFEVQKMQDFSDDHLETFRRRSDAAFQQMQQQADREMARFLQTYGGESLDTFGETFRPPVATKSSLSTAPVGVARGTAEDPRATSFADTLGVGHESIGKARSPSAVSAMTIGGMAEIGTSKGPLVEGAAGMGPPPELAGVLNDFELLTGDLKEEAASIGREAVRGTKDILQGTRSDLGRMAKQEAAELRAAAQRALQEERDLRNLKGVAQQEMQKAQERLRAQAEQMKGDVLGQVQGMAQGTVERLKQAGSRRLGVDPNLPIEPNESGT